MIATYLGGNKYIRTWNDVLGNFVPNCFTHFLLVVVQKCGIQMAISQVNCSFDYGDSFAAFELIWMNWIQMVWYVFIWCHATVVFTKIWENCVIKYLALKKMKIYPIGAQSECRHFDAIAQCNRWNSCHYSLYTHALLTHNRIYTSN